MPDITNLLSIATVFKFLIPKIERPEWAELNEKLKERLRPMNQKLASASDTSSVIDIANETTATITKFLEDNSEIFEKITENDKEKKYIKHDNKALSKLKQRKKEIKRLSFSQNGTFDQKKEYRKILRAISDIKKITGKMMKSSS